MNKNFWFTLLAFIFMYIYIPEIGAIIRVIGVFIFLCQLSAVLSNQIVHSGYLPKLLIPPTNRLVLVTGCDSGFGLATARRLESYGFYVLAGVLSDESDGCKYLNSFGSKRLRTIKLDVTKQEDVDDAINLVARLTNFKPILNDPKRSQPNAERKFPKLTFGHQIDGDLELWALINNAGLAQFTPFEFGTIEEDLKPMFEVNVFGLTRLTKAFLPFLRQSKGRLVNVGSVTDRVTISGLTGYSMSKHAVRSLTDGLRQELHEFNIKAILIEPTLYKTPISNLDQLIKKFNTTFERTDQIIRDDYGDETYRKEFTAHLKKMILLTRNNIEEVVNSVEDAVINSTPRDQYWCASGLQKFLFWFIEQLSIEITDRLCTIKPPQTFVDFVQKINDSS